jgi:4-alpha-glucanotransferase
MRASGVLMHISSLPGGTGIGTLGKEAYEFVDFLKASGQTYWQVLPLCPTSYGDSPYQSFSTFAGNPYFIDFDSLYNENLLKKSDYSKIKWFKNPEKIDFNLLYKNRFNVLKKAFDNFNRENSDYIDFCDKNSFWLDDFALYMALKNKFNGFSWNEWPQDFKTRKKDIISNAKKEMKEDVGFQKFVQYIFFKQWNDLKKYTNENGIKIIGDIPIYVAGDSADVWANPKQFLLDEDCNPIEVAGCPPDAFSEDGQLWGNPLYDWEFMKKDGYSWWKNRIEHLCKMCDVIRIDHFRGFESYYCIPADSKTAKIGEWRKGPGIEFFKEIEKSLGKKEIIAEDLGYLTPAVKKMLKQSKYPGMKVLQFAFDTDEENDYLLHNFTKNSVAYAGTHDNDTIIGYMTKTAPRKTRKRAKEYLRLTRREGYNWGFMKAVWSSNSDTAIVTMQDLLGLGNEARMNFPSTVKDNWQWRAKSDYITDELTEKLRYYTKLYQRIPKKKRVK